MPEVEKYLNQNGSFKAQSTVRSQRGGLSEGRRVGYPGGRISGVGYRDRGVGYFRGGRVSMG